MRCALLDPKNRVGGMSTGGLGHSDVGGYPSTTIGGLAREFYTANGAYYGKKDAEYNLEPHVALALFHDMLNRTSPGSVDLFQRAQVVSAFKSGAFITGLETTAGDLFRGSVFIDASYEGDLTARAGVTFTHGRESAGRYNESLAGWRSGVGEHQFQEVISPFDANGQILPMVQPFDADEFVGKGDGKQQAYNFRLCATKNKSNQVSFPKPVNYDPTYWELARRYFNHPKVTSAAQAPCGNVKGYCGGPIPNEKWDLNNGGPISTDFIGGSSEYPTADYQTRELIFQEHKDYTLGFLYFMSNDPDLNETVRAKFQQWGLCKDEFEETDNFPPQLYVRSVIRVVGSQVFTQNTPAKRRLWGEESAGCGSYSFDSHHAQRQACHNLTECLGYGPVGAANDAPFTWNEGDVEIGPGVYDIPMWVLLPKPEEVLNLLVPGTPSASHIGMSTLRMEPQFMIMGHSAGLVAALAAGARHSNSQSKANVHTVNKTILHAQLLEDGQLMNEACQPSQNSPVYGAQEIENDS
jgi:hypothetical protein